MSNLLGHRIKITILLPDTVSTVRIVIPTRWTKNRTERQNYSVSHNGRWDYGTSELKYYGEKVENKKPRQQQPDNFRKQYGRRQIHVAADGD